MNKDMWGFVAKERGRVSGRESWTRRQPGRGTPVDPLHRILAEGPPGW